MPNFYCYDKTTSRRYMSEKIKKVKDDIKASATKTVNIVKSKLSSVLMKDDSKVIDCLFVLKRISVVPYSVLGIQLTNTQKIIAVALPPDANCLFVDPAGLQMIQKLGPDAAGGASGAIYSFLDISDTFPIAVRKAVRNVGDAYWHKYKVSRKNGEEIFHCCHAVGPNFSEMLQTPSESEAIIALTRVYKNIFREFIRSRLSKLRMLPVSGGIFAGKLRESIPYITFVAISQAILQLRKSEVAYLHLTVKSIEMCIYEEYEFASFKKTASINYESLSRKIKNNTSI